MMVKICGITNREDALAAIDGGASALGFNFYPQSPRYVDPDRAAEIIGGLPGSVWKVGVFVDEPPERVNELARRIGLDVVQLYNLEDVLRVRNIRTWHAIHVGPEFVLGDQERYPAEAVLLDSPAGKAFGGTGRTFDWSRAAGFRKLKIILAGGLDAENVRQAIATVRPWGVDVCSRIESAPGRKDHAKMAQFLKEATS